jgi:hypothetical protein
MYFIQYKAADLALDTRKVNNPCEVGSAVDEIEAEGGSVWHITDKNGRVVTYDEIREACTETQ